MSGLGPILELTKQELLKRGDELERDRLTLHMHIYFTRGVWRWLTATHENDGEWKAENHFKFALLMLETRDALP